MCLCACADQRRDSPATCSLSLNGSRPCESVAECIAQSVFLKKNVKR